ncbi:unnamed protein product [Brassicogethes aeneus]|uniref:C2H2-type domain-containing protein n=1 Tax=Brassicogethes aeneus TaxID=1431903 RepID=A0A9P0B471_BRAAE|nr:unnamed protein product [Brassicogethes aeneus]
MMHQTAMPLLIPIKNAIESVGVANPNIQIVAENIDESQQTVVYQVVYPEELDLKPTITKRGRPKRKQTAEKKNVQPVPVDPPKTARTRSGRLVKLPKHIEKDFEKIEITDELEIETSAFVRFEDKNKENSDEFKKLDMHQRKRTISAQYRCPKCQKAYLGKAKMIQHLQKYPDHGPLPDKLKEANFDVWNYLVDITQKSPPGRRGSKFCEELTNLLHNVQLLTTALFKKNEGDNCVEIDKVLGNAIGVNPGNYKFDENELYKDVTVLKLITNSDFFNAKSSNNIFKVEEKLKNTAEVKNTENASYFSAPPINQNSSNLDVILNEFTYTEKNFNADLPNLPNNYQPFTKKENNTHIIEHNTIINYDKKNVPILDNRIDLLSENSLLTSLPHSSVDELMSAVDSTSNLLDNSSSDEVMNVDQFVNERFKRITEPDIDLSNSLNLDLPSLQLDLFQFHTN